MAPDDQFAYGRRVAIGVQAAESPELDLSQRPFVIFHPSPPRPESKPDIPLSV